MSIGKTISRYMGKLKGSSSKPKSIAPRKGEGLDELKLDQAQDTARLKKKDADANTLTGKLKGALTMKSSGRYKEALNSSRQKEKSIKGAMKDRASDRFKKKLGYTGTAAGATATAVVGKKLIDEKENSKKINRKAEAVSRRVSRYNQKLQKMASEIDKEANALSRAISKAYKGGDTLKASRMMSKGQGGTKGMSSNDVKNAVQGVSAQAKDVGGKGGTSLISSKGAENYAKGHGKDATTTTPIAAGMAHKNLVKLHQKTRKASGSFKNLPKKKPPTMVAPKKPKPLMGGNKLPSPANNPSYKQKLKEM